MLIAAIVGLDTRSTMDLDTTVNGLQLSEDSVSKAILEVCNIKLDDDVVFTIQSCEQIRKEDQYGGFCVRIDAIYDTIATPLSIDITTGDIITPSPVQYEFSGIFDDDIIIKLWGYNIESVLAEKLETILSRGVFNTRPRDFYDVYILTKTQPFNVKTLKEALNATAEHRGSKERISDIEFILNQLSESKELQDSWLKYQKKFSYAKGITYNDIITRLKDVVVVL